MLTGQGWETSAEDFGGEAFFLSPFAGVVHAVGCRPHYAAWTADGELVSSRRVTMTNRWFSEREFGRPLGVVDGRIVVHYSGIPEPMRVGVDTLPQGLRLYEVSDGRVTEVREGMPDLVFVTRRQVGGTFEGGAEGPGVMVAARGGTIVRGVYQGRVLTVVDPSGRTIATGEVDADLANLTIDSDGRIWAHTSARDAGGILGSIVFTPDLSAELFRVAVVNVMDASGDFLLAIGQGRGSSRPILLLRMRPLGPNN